MKDITAKSNSLKNIKIKKISSSNNDKMENISKQENMETTPFLSFILEERASFNCEPQIISFLTTQILYQITPLDVKTL